MPIINTDIWGGRYHLYLPCSEVEPVDVGPERRRGRRLTGELQPRPQQAP